MISGSCHCGAIEFDLHDPRDFITKCNCSLCRRAGALWIHSTREKVDLRYDPSKVIRYITGDKTLATISCSTCGNTTHWESLADAGPETPVAVNVAMSDPDVVAKIRIRHFDGADTWAYLD